MSTRQLSIGAAAVVLAVVSGPLCWGQGNRKPGISLDGIGQVACPGNPGVLSVWGESAVPLITAKSSQIRLPVAAAATYGKGRIVAFAHDGYLDGRNLDTADTRALMTRVMRFLSPGQDAPKIAVVGRRDFVVQLLQPNPIEPDRITSFSRLDPKSVDLLVVKGSEIPVKDADAVAKFVQDGGSLLIADTGWGWEQLNPDKSLLRDHGGNQVLRRAGLAFTSGMVSADGGGQIEVSTPDPLTHAAAALASLEDTQSPAAPAERRARRALTSTVVLAAAEIAPADSAFSRSLQQRLSGLRNMTGPTPEKPLDESRPFERVAHLLQLRSMEDLPADQVKAHPSAAAFPGAVPANAPRVQRTVDIDLTQRRWQSTGLYAAPGDKITLAVSDMPEGFPLRVRIGAHTDNIQHLNTWKRPPEISRSWPLVSGANTVASPFGGAIYIEVPEAAAPAQPPKVVIRGAVEAPMYVLGKTTRAQWQSIRNAPAPWAEFVVPGRVVLTFRSDSIREMDDPGPVMEHWKKILDAMADFGGISRDRPFAERIVTDVQISAGYMHSGYPIMTHLDVSTDIVDLKALNTVEKGWGFYHELGHNHQKPEWTFDGTGEVTNNVFVHYVLETVCGLPEAEASKRALGPEMRQLTEAHLKDPDFARWKREPFLALAMYAQVHTTFGWKPFIQVFAEYEALPVNQRPRSEQAKRDEWMVRLSRAVNRNLGPFFDAWGVPVTPRAKAEIADLPAWQPPRPKSR